MRCYFASLPHPFWCPLCRAYVTKWHAHHGPYAKWKPGMAAPIIDRTKPVPGQYRGTKWNEVPA
jgi:hypothetical protein